MHKTHIFVLSIIYFYAEFCMHPNSTVQGENKINSFGINLIGLNGQYSNINLSYAHDSDKDLRNNEQNNIQRYIQTYHFIAFL